MLSAFDLLKDNFNLELRVTISKTSREYYLMFDKTIQCWCWSPWTVRNTIKIRMCETAMLGNLWILKIW